MLGAFHGIMSLYALKIRGENNVVVGRSEQTSVQRRAGPSGSFMDQTYNSICRLLLKFYICWHDLNSVSTKLEAYELVTE